MWVQIGIILVSLYLLRLLLRSGTSTISAWKKFGLIGLAVAMVVTVLNPEATTRVAQLMGVGRGADLLLYALSAAFVVYALSQYVGRQKDRDRMYRLARRITLLDAVERYGVHDERPPELPPPSSAPPRNGADRSD